RRKDRPEGLLHQIRYDRAVLYEQSGQRARARSEFERIFAADPRFDDVGVRLGIVRSGANEACAAQGEG
ncbi:MAG: hypothetical protein JJU07_14555, partial [Natronohydrobacter sp.]|nr:hypothetical protein [Natronohydrobacter sp.]